MRHIGPIVAALFFYAACPDAKAADYPERVRSYLDSAAKLCTEHGGTLRTPDDRTVRSST